jgi:hypothetical protein
MRSVAELVVNVLWQSKVYTGCGRVNCMRSVAEYSKLYTICGKVSCMRCVVECLGPHYYY